MWMRDTTMIHRSISALHPGLSPSLRTGIDPVVGIRAEVSIIIPALILPGAVNEPATIAGRGPIGPDDATRLAAEAPSMIRIIACPVSNILSQPAHAETSRRLEGETNLPGRSRMDRPTRQHRNRPSRLIRALHRLNPPVVCVGGSGHVA